jgi:hypothetical protein
MTCFFGTKVNAAAEAVLDRDAFLDKPLLLVHDHWTRQQVLTRTAMTEIKEQMRIPSEPGQQHDNSLLALIPILLPLLLPILLLLDDSKKQTRRSRRHKESGKKRKRGKECSKRSQHRRQRGEK